MVLPETLPGPTYAGIAYLVRPYPANLHDTHSDPRPSTAWGRSDWILKIVAYAYSVMRAFIQGLLL